MGQLLAGIHCSDFRTYADTIDGIRLVDAVAISHEARNREFFSGVVKG